LGFDLRATTLGQLLRGGAAGAFARLLATRLAARAVEALTGGEYSVLVRLKRAGVTTTRLLGGRRVEEADRPALAGPCLRACPKIARRVGRQHVRHTVNEHAVSGERRAPHGCAGAAGRYRTQRFDQAVAAGPCATSFRATIRIKLVHRHDVAGCTIQQVLSCTTAAAQRDGAGYPERTGAAP
jgi:hypothetical protein